MQEFDQAGPTKPVRLRLKAGSALALSAIGRTVGWTAHALEQQAQEKLPRRRARYTGPAATG